MKYHVSLGLLALAATMASASDGSASSESSVYWTEENCPDGHVHDAVCCSDDYCKDYGSEKACLVERKCLWKAEDEECVLNRDDSNNVCCKSETTENCKAIADGICPYHFQVKEGCCDESSMKYTGVLTTDEGYVCCNTPCTSAEENNCDKPANCSMGGYFARSLGGYGYEDPNGFSPHLVPHSAQSHGKVIDFTGFETHLGHLNVHKPPKKDKKVPELTVDDLMESLIKALTNDKGTVNKYDVFEFDEKIINDPYLGKTQHGGRIGGINLPDPNIFLKQIYGSPYGIGLGPYGEPNHGSGYPSYPYPGGHGYEPEYPSGPSYPSYGYETPYKSTHGYPDPYYGKSYKSSYPDPYYGKSYYGKSYYEKPYYGKSYKSSYPDPYESAYPDPYPSPYSKPYPSPYATPYPDPYYPTSYPKPYAAPYPQPHGSRYPKSHGPQYPKSHGPQYPSTSEPQYPEAYPTESSSQSYPEPQSAY